MRNKKDLILVLSLTALLGLTSCTKPAPKPEPEPEPEPVLKEWTELEKKQMIQLGGMVLPTPAFDESAVELVLPDIEEGYISTSSYDVQINMTKVAQADFDAWLEKAAEDNEWEEAGEEGGSVYYYAYLSDNEESTLSAQIEVDVEGGTINVFPIAYSWADAMEWYDMQAANCGLEKTFTSVFGEDFPSYSTKTSVFWTTGALTKLADYSAKGWDDAYPMVEIYDNTAAAEAAFKEGLADANFHIFGWTRRDGSTNTSVYTSGDATNEGGLLFQQLGSGRGNLVYLLDGYTDAKYHEGDDICHPSIDAEGALAALKTNLNLKDEDIHDGRKEYAGSYNFSVDALENETILELFTRIGNANDELLELDEESVEEIFEDATPEGDPQINGKFDGEEGEGEGEETEKVLVEKYGEFVKGGVTVAIDVYLDEEGAVKALVEVFDANWKYGYTALEAATVINEGWTEDPLAEPEVETIGGSKYFVYNIAGSLYSKAALAQYGVTTAGDAWDFFGLDYCLPRGVMGDLAGASFEDTACEAILMNDNYYANISVTTYNYPVSETETVECWAVQIYVVDLATEVPAEGGAELLRTNSYTLAVVR